MSSAATRPTGIRAGIATLSEGPYSTFGRKTRRHHPQSKGGSQPPPMPPPMRDAATGDALTGQAA